MPKEILQMTEVKPYNIPNAKWYRNHLMDLSVMFTSGGKILSFELMFNQNGKSYLLKWEKDQVLKFIVDMGEQDNRKNRSPLIVGQIAGTPEIQSDLILKYFTDYSLELPSNTRNFVIEHLSP